MKKKGIEKILTTSKGIEISIINGTDGSNVYLLFDGKEAILIDSAFETDFELISNELSFYLKNENKLSKIVLTHYHKDHSGGAESLSKKFNSKILISNEDNKVFSHLENYITLPKEISDGTRKFLNSSNMWEKCFSPTNEWFPKIDKIINNGDKIMNFEAIVYPGHTNGTIVLYDSLDKILISSDYLVYPRGIFPTFFKSFVKSVNIDIKKAIDSTSSILKLNFDTLLPGHGSYLKKNAKSILKKSDLYGELIEK
jgi:glyoxylase-like metal-dependent hydrolase (beta-lactamase superfamily II)